MSAQRGPCPGWPNHFCSLKLKGKQISSKTRQIGGRHDIAIGNFLGCCYQQQSSAQLWDPHWSIDFFCQFQDIFTDQSFACSNCTQTKGFFRVSECLTNSEKNSFVNCAKYWRRIRKISWHFALRICSVSWCQTGSLKLGEKVLNEVLTLSDIF